MLDTQAASADKEKSMGASAAQLTKDKEELAKDKEALSKDKEQLTKDLAQAKAAAAETQVGVVWLAYCSHL
jgi:hypothetical protein